MKPGIALSLGRRMIPVLAVAMLVSPFSVIVSLVAAEDEEAPETVFRMGFMQRVDSMNPNLGLIDASYVFYGLVYDTPQCIDGEMNAFGNLVRETRVVPETDPDLALTGRPYGSVWEYEITPNARYHDGQPFTIDDFVWNMNLHSENYDTMWAFQPYSHFVDYTEAVDDKTARIYFYNRETGEPMPCSYAYMMAVFMLPMHLLLDEVPSDIAFAWDGTIEGYDPPIVGTGPFMAGPDILEEWRAGDRLTLYKNPSYHWQKDYGLNISFDRIEMLFYDDATSMRLALTSGDLDIAQFPPETYKAIKDGIEDGTYKNIKAYDGPKCTQYWTEIEFCMDGGGPNPSRLDPAIRQALATATDKSYIISNFYRGYADEGNTLIPNVNTLWHYEPTEAEKFHYDLDAAAQMLEDAGYRYPYEGAEYRVATADSLAVDADYVLENTELVYHMYIRREYPEEKQIAQYLQETWAQVGVGIEYEVVDESYMSTKVYSYYYDTCIWYWSADIDPNYMLFCQSSFAWSGWSDNKYYNPAYEENYTKSVMTMDYAERKMYVDNCQRIHYNDCAFIIMANNYQTYAWRTDTFEGYGDWDAEPGRSLDNFWTGNPLFFDLEFVGEPEEGFDLEAALIAGGVIAAILAAVVVFVLVGKKKGKKKSKSPLGE